MAYRRVCSREEVVAASRLGKGYFVESASGVEELGLQAHPPIALFFSRDRVYAIQARVSERANNCTWLLSLVAAHETIEGKYRHLARLQYGFSHAGITVIRSGYESTSACELSRAFSG